MHIGYLKRKKGEWFVTLRYEDYALHPTDSFALDSGYCLSNHRNLEVRFRLVECNIAGKKKFYARLV